MLGDRKILIVGAGLGGMTAALSMKQAGLDVTLVEQSAELGDVGAGITLGPNATRVLSYLGVEEALRPWVAVPDSVGVNHVYTGEVLSKTLRGEAQYREQFGAPLWHGHRADIHGVLAAAARAADIPIELNKHLVYAEHDGDRATAVFSDGTRTTCDLLVGADGLKSSVRKDVFGADEPQFTGFVAWRGLIPREPTRLEPDFLAYAAPQKLFARYPVRQRTLLNFVAMAKSDLADDEDWTCKSTPQAALDAYEGCCDEIREIIASAPEDACYKWALHVRKPLKSWIEGPITLLGDAAHPMTPFLGMGAGMAIEDAMVLARVLSQYDNWDEALTVYQAMRLPRANLMFEESAARGRSLTGEDSDQLRRPRGEQEDLDFAYLYDATSVALSASVPA